MTHTPAVKDQPDADGTPLLLGEQTTQIRLHLHRISGFRQPKATREAQHVSVDGQPGQPESDGSNHVGRLA